MKKNIFFSFAVLALICIPAGFVVAEVDFDAGGGVDSDAGRGTDFDSSNTVKLENPLGVDSFPALIEAILNAAFVIGLPIAVLFIAFAGFRFVWARGNPTELTKAKTNFLYTIVGIGVFFGAWLLAKVIETTITTIRSGL